MSGEEGPVHQQTEHEEIEELARRKPPPAFELVVNRGTGTIDSPTLEVSWRFPDEVIALRPTHVLVFLQYLDHLEPKDANRRTREQRHVFPVADALGYIPLYWAGKVRVFAWALSDEALRCAHCQKYSEHESRETKTVAGLITFATKKCAYADFYWNPDGDRLCGRQYDLLNLPNGWNQYVNLRHDLTRRWGVCCEESFHRNNHFPLAAIAELELQVPAEIFAPRPKTWLTKALWKWVNLWHDGEPRDECAYHKRKILAFTLQPPVMLIYWTARCAFGLLVALIVMTLRIVAWALGFQPRPFIADVVEIIRVENYRHEFWQRFRGKTLQGPLNCGDYRKLRLGSWQFKAPVTIAELAYVGSLGCLLAYPELNESPSTFDAAGSFVAIITTIVLIATIWFYRALNGLCPKWREWFKKPAPKAETAEERLAREKLETERQKKFNERRQRLLEEIHQSQEAEQLAYKDWLAKNCGRHTPGNDPRPLWLPPLPKPRDASFVKRVQLKLQFIKARVCRTFDRGNKR